MPRLSELKPLLRIPLNEDAYLRQVLPSDVTEAYVNGLNDPLVNRFLGRSRERLQTRETVRTYVEENFKNANDVLFGMFIDGGLRGTVRLHDVREDTRVGTIGVLIFDTNYWQKGWGRRAIAAIVEFARRELGIQTFKAGMVAQNTPSRNTFACLGFRHFPERDTTDSQGTTIEYWQLDIND